MTLYNQVQKLKDALKNIILGQDHLIDRLLMALFANGHLLVEGAPGLAKTKSIKTLASFIEADFHRIQFTPDLLPADITGTEIYRPNEGTFVFQQGPVFHNLILADEINRAMAKVQSALLEAMGEGQISIGKKTYYLPKLFLVMATQNPIEQEGTFSLPEAQLDRFMMQVNINYPSAAVEKAILQLNHSETLNDVNTKSQREILLKQSEIFAIRKEILNIHMDPTIEEYIVQIIMATRTPKKYNNDLAEIIEYGASPRATIYLSRCARCLAWLKNRDFVMPGDIQEVAKEILRHRLGLSFKAEIMGKNVDNVIDDILELVPLP